MGGGSSGGGGTSTVYQSTLPEYARPYFENIMERTRSVSEQPYSPYTGDRIAGLNSLQTSAINNLGNYGGNSGAYGTASGMVAQGANMFGNIANSGPGAYGLNNGARSGFENFSGPQTVGAERAGVGMWDQPTADYYMSPYQRNVTDIQKREANRQYAIQDQGLQDSLVKRGSFGGTRQAIMQAEGDRNQSMLLNDIEQKGQQSAYENAQAQFERDRNASLATQNINIRSGLEAALANQGAGMDFQKLLEQARGTNLGQMAGMNNQQLGAAQGMLSAGSQYGNLAGGQQNDFFSYLNQLGDAGKQLQGMDQQRMDLAYNDFANMRDYERNNLNFMSGIMRGVPTSTSGEATRYEPTPSFGNTVAGLGGIAASMATR